MKRNPFDKFTNDVIHMIVFAKSNSIDAQVDKIYPEAFLIGTLLTGENVVTESLELHGVDIEDCIKRLKRILNKKNCKDENDLTSITIDDIGISEGVNKAIEEADTISTNLGHDFIGIGHIFCAIMNTERDLRFIFSSKCKKFKDCLNDIVSVRYNKDKGSRKKSIPVSADESINSYCVDLTEMASLGKFDPIISRDKEIESAITILCRRSKSNPILIGEAGTGKTAIVEGIAQRIASNAVPKKLKGYKIYSLNMSSVVAGTKYRGDFEKRIQTLIRALEKQENCIIFIDEIHTIVGAGGAGSAMDAANLLKPALARDLKCIGATTNQEYKKYVEKDGALARRFGPVFVEEPTDLQVKKILYGIKENYEKYHECKISNEAIGSIISLTKRYRPTKFFPDKAIDCMDTACAKCSWIDVGEGEKPLIGPKEIAEVISQQSNIPIDVILWDNNKRIKETEASLRCNVVGQSEAINSVCKILRNAYSGVRNPEKPLGVLVFGGPSGTGKTHLSKQLSNSIFGSEKNIIRLDMTEYSEEHSISKIIGSPPGYTGFQETNVVVDSIKRKPYSVLLLDEVEKSHPKVMKLFLQVMSDGSMTNANGEKIDCKNLLFIMTGNFDSGSYNKSEIGFRESELSEIEGKRIKLIDFCKKMYGNEFVNRVDSFIPFLPLSEEELIKVCEMKMKLLSDRVSNEDILVKFSKNIPKAIIEKQKSDHGINAMAIERVIASNIEPLVADAIIEKNNSSKEKITLTITVNKENEFRIRKYKK
jgi:ATP-dependent Clp protease ATP-binding subunit ClpC